MGDRYMTPSDGTGLPAGRTPYLCPYGVLVPPNSQELAHEANPWPWGSGGRAPGDQFFE